MEDDTEQIVSDLDNPGSSESKDASPHQDSVCFGVGKQKREKGTLYACTECGKRFKRRYVLVEHLRGHTGERPFSCDECGKKFTRRKEIQRHTKLHLGVKRHSCDTCGKSFSEKCHLRAHERVHTGEKPYYCDICGRSFNHSTTLRLHRRIHSGERAFCCDECGKTFTQKPHLTEHRRVHTGEKPFTCSECGNHFSHKSALNRHKKVHTGEKPFICPDCGKGFSRESYLTRHAHTHSDETHSRTCTECGKSFSRKVNLVLHQKTHFGEKSLMCSDCKECFLNIEDLNSHREICPSKAFYNCPKCGRALSVDSKCDCLFEYEFKPSLVDCMHCGRKTIGFEDICQQCQALLVDKNSEKSDNKRLISEMILIEENNFEDTSLDKNLQTISVKQEPGVSEISVKNEVDVFDICNEAKPEPGIDIAIDDENDPLSI